MSGRAWHKGREALVGGAPLALVVTCAGSRLLEVTREDRPRVISTAPSTAWPNYKIDARGVFTTAQDDGEPAFDWYVDDVLPLQCTRHGYHRVIVRRRRLVMEWQACDSRLNTARVIGVSRVEAPGRV